jgi:hypothetical protein
MLSVRPVQMRSHLETLLAPMEDAGVGVARSPAPSHPPPPPPPPPGHVVVAVDTSHTTNTSDYAKVGTDCIL